MVKINLSLYHIAWLIQAELTAVMMSANAGLREAPPTKKPSTSACFMRSPAFYSVTEPPYIILVELPALAEMLSFNQLLT